MARGAPLDYLLQVIHLPDYHNLLPCSCNSRIQPFSRDHGAILQCHDDCRRSRSLEARNVSLALRPGGIFAVQGKNGMGKSTLLKTLMDFVRPTSGTVPMDGADVTHLAPQRLAARTVAYAPQEFTLFQDLTVEEKLRLSVPHDSLFRQRLPMLDAGLPGHFRARTPFCRRLDQERTGWRLVR